MANFVTKKDGTRVPFDPEKLKASIAAAATDSGLSDDEAKNIGEEISGPVISGFEGQEEVTSADVKERILAELDVTHPAVAEAWRKYEEGKGQ